MKRMTTRIMPVPRFLAILLLAQSRGMLGFRILGGAKLASPYVASTFLAIAAPLSIGLENMGLVMPLLESTSAPAPQSLPSTAEAEIFTDLAHVGLDLLTFFSPGKLVLRLGILIGRLSALAADYIPDHAIRPEELVFQATMLLVAWVGLVNALLPLVLAQSQVSVRDGKAYRRLFESTGMSWSTFKSVSALALDFVDLPAGHVVENSNDYVYWLFKGNLTIGEDTIMHKSNGSKLLLESNLLRHLEKPSGYWDQTPEMSTHADHGGATLLRIHVDPLRELMDNDADVAYAVRALLLRSIHEKLLEARELAPSATTRA